MQISNNSYMESFQYWLDSPAISETEWSELSAIQGDEKEIESRFYAPLEFGTAGLRGVMGMGLHRMNIHIIRHATQAFATVIKAEGKEACEKGVVICFDCREKSDVFAREAACVMAANGIMVRLFEGLRPTPELSFAIRHYGAVAGINVTASHNPREYNGYKVYWSDGAQLPPQRAEAIALEMENTDVFTSIENMSFGEASENGMITMLGAETDEAFLAKVMSQSIMPEVVARVADRLKIVYTPFHGTGYILVPEALKRLGITQLIPVEEQMKIDGTFPTVHSPNPEDPAGFELAAKLAEETGSDLVIGTDPDADRVAAMARDKNGVLTAISGNQMGVLLLDYIIKARKEKGTLPKNAAAVKSIVTTELAKEIAVKNGVHFEDTFTGFKFMAEKVAEYEKAGSHEYIFAYEESIGYMMGDYVRDKDAVTASMMIAEMAAYYMDKDMTLIDALEAIFEEYSYHEEKTLNLVMPGVDGLERMAALMNRLREDFPNSIGGTQVARVRDYQSGWITVAGLGAVEQTTIVGSNVLYCELADGTSFIVRPSGTEPKIKIYILAKGSRREECLERIGRYEEFANSLKN